ncbi:MAG: hypothetical protein WBO10_11815 [Pyrinomonadaceae bacterium]
MTTPETKKLADKIAKMLEAESQSGDLAGLYASIEKVNHRLDKLEQVENIPHSTLRTPQSTHPSLDKLNIAEAIADSIFGAKFKEKACQFEPDKPCDHCSMCNSRGF